MSTLELIRETFHPEPYPTLENDITGALLHCFREGVGNCKYVLLVSEIGKMTDIRTLIQSQKKELKKFYHASVMKGIGVIEIFLGKHADWKTSVHDVKPDWHGLQSVILQGLLFIDPETKRHELTQSHWGPIKLETFKDKWIRFTIYEER